MSLVVVCGGSGMVGRELIALLQERGQDFMVVGRDAGALRNAFPAAARCLSWAEFSEADVSNIRGVVNLAGAGVTDKRWSPVYKKVMAESRLKSTAICAAVCAKDSRIHLLNASSIHAYGIYAEDHAPFTESESARSTSTCYLQDLIADWEAATLPALQAGNAVTLLRIGVVLATEGGALPSLAAPFKFLIGGRHGTGKQIMPWVSLRDLAKIIDFLIERPELTGPVNGVAPGACTNQAFVRALGKALKRPAILPLPAGVLRLIMGEAADELVLTGQRVLPRKLLDAGFNFADREIADCLQHLLG